MTYHELVKKVQTALAKADASKVEGHIAVQVNVTGEAEGAFYMEIADGVLYVAPYDYNDRDALLTADGKDVLAVAQGKVSLEAAIAEGKVAHEGDYDKTLTLGAAIPAKKATTKKTAAKTVAKPDAETEKPKRGR
ncbi:MAG: SCP2 sterol-binding domain-containing protein, partial [Oscillospiraceae bacterium]|nr:SCP2 sterol-binding domain-containing protein [Oscillospiraceae bacterium]